MQGYGSASELGLADFMTEAFLKEITLYSSVSQLILFNEPMRYWIADSSLEYGLIRLDVTSPGVTAIREGEKPLSMPHYRISTRTTWQSRLHGRS